MKISVSETDYKGVGSIRLQSDLYLSYRIEELPDILEYDNTFLYSQV